MINWRFVLRRVAIFCWLLFGSLSLYIPMLKWWSGRWMPELALAGALAFSIWMFVLTMFGTTFEVMFWENLL